MAPIYVIPAHDALPEFSVRALTALAHAKSTSSDEAGEYFAMAIASKTPSAQFHADSVFLVPLIPSDEASSDEVGFA